MVLATRVFSYEKTQQGSLLYKRRAILLKFSNITLWFFYFRVPDIDIFID